MQYMPVGPGSSANSLGPLGTAGLLRWCMQARSASLAQRVADAWGRIFSCPHQARLHDTRMLRAKRNQASHHGKSEDRRAPAPRPARPCSMPSTAVANHVVA